VTALYHWFAATDAHQGVAVVLLGGMFVALCFVAGPVTLWLRGRIDEAITPDPLRDRAEGVRR
jgi:hypothetical protein